MEKTADYAILATMALTPKSGCFTMAVDNKKMLPKTDLFTPYEFEMLRNFSFNPDAKNTTMKLTQGEHILTLSAEPKNKDSLGSNIGIDFLWLLPK